MTDSEGEAEIVRARSIGGLVGVFAALGTGGLLAYLAHSSAVLAALVVLGSVAVAVFAYRAGQVAGRAIALRSLWMAAPIGALAGLCSLLVTALLAAAVGLCWGLYDGIHGPDWAWSYLGKPFFAVIFYGGVVATLTGVLAGIVIRALIARGR